MITDTDITRQVAAAIEANGAEHAKGIDVDGVVAEIQSTYGLVDVDMIDHDAFWGIVARHDATQADAPSVTLGTPEQAALLAGMPQLAGNGHRLAVRGAAVELTDDALDVLADLTDEHDGHFDGTAIWIGGTAYPVARA